MKNIYQLLEIPYNSNLVDICAAFKTKCLNNPQNTFLYTQAFLILTNNIKKLFYDAALFHIDVCTLYQNIERYTEYEDVDEFELLPYLEWLIDFQNFFYDTKFLTNNTTYKSYIEKWYDVIDNIIESIKERINSFYLA